MPAVTNNDTILKAINQMVQALLDLNIGSGGGGGDCPDVTVNLPAPVVNVTVRCGGYGGGGSDIGSGSPIDDDEATGTTPPQAGDPVDEAKCKRVNFIIDKYINFMGIWSAVNGLLAIGPAEMMAAYLAGTSTLLGAFSSLLVAGAVVTLFWAVVALFIGGGLTTAYIVAHLVSVNSNRADWVCAMYNAGDVAELRQAIVDFLGDNLAGLPQSFVEYHVDHLFPNNVLNGVFNGWTGDVAAELDAYTSPADCGGCAGDWYTANGVPMRDEHAVLQSQWAGGYHSIYVEYTSLGDIEELSFSNYNSLGDGLTYVDSNGVFHRPMVPPSELLPILLKGFGAASSTPFTITIYHRRG